MPSVLVSGEEIFSGLLGKHRPDVPGLPDTISIRSALFQQPTFKKLLDSRMCIDNVATVIVTR